MSSGDGRDPDPGTQAHGPGLGDLGPQTRTQGGNPDRWPENGNLESAIKSQGRKLGGQLVRYLGGQAHMGSYGTYGACPGQSLAVVWVARVNGCLAVDGVAHLGSANSSSSLHCKGQAC